MANALILRRKQQRRRRIRLMMLKVVILLALAAGVVLFLKRMYMEQESTAVSQREEVMDKNYLTCRSSCDILILRQKYYDCQSNNRKPPKDADQILILGKEGGRGECPAENE